MKKRRRLKKKFVIFLTLYICIICSFFISNTLSKFKDNVIKSGNVDVAKWNVSAVLPSETLNIVAGNGAQNYNLSVTSTSGVASTYSVVLSNLPDNVKVSIDGVNYVTPSSNIIEFNNVGSFQANDINTTKNHILSFKTDDLTNEIIGRSVDIDVIFTQSRIN